MEDLKISRVEPCSVKGLGKKTTNKWRSSPSTCLGRISRAVEAWPESEPARTLWRALENPTACSVLGS